MDLSVFVNGVANEYATDPFIIVSKHYLVEDHTIIHTDVSLSRIFELVQQEVSLRSGLLLQHHIV